MLITLGVEARNLFQPLQSRNRRRLSVIVAQFHLSFEGYRRHAEFVPPETHCFQGSHVVNRSKLTRQINQGAKNSTLLAELAHGAFESMSCDKAK